MAAARMVLLSYAFLRSEFIFFITFVEEDLSNHVFLENPFFEEFFIAPYASSCQSLYFRL